MDEFIKMPAPIIDPDDDGSVVREIGHLHFRTERQRPVRSRELVQIKNFAAGRLLSLMILAVIRGQAIEGGLGLRRRLTNGRAADWILRPSPGRRELQHQQKKERKQEIL